ncbi:MAG: peptide deformylase [Planctomycetota bacterium]|nr:MAG: peptide deformylase [Planctomycetota bacterium]
MRIIKYPDPRLRKKCAPVTEFNDELRALATRMLELMKAAPGVGLAAPQVGVLLRMFVCNVTGEEGDDCVLVNPEIRDASGWKEAEEGCLSIPEVYVQVRRSLRCTVVAQDLDGNPIELRGEDLPARVWQHETDHLNGVLILDRMGPADEIATRKKLRELEAQYAASG